MKEFRVVNFGPIENASVMPGNLTFLVGAQAGGKSLFLETMKLWIDKDAIVDTLEKYSYVTTNDTDKVLNLYYGEGMAKIWNENSSICSDGDAFLKETLSYRIEKKEERVFYVPAQRILSLTDGRPKNFMEFDNTTPYVLRAFSETLRLFMQQGLSESGKLFPLNQRLNQETLLSLNNSIFHDAKVLLEERMGQKKMFLHTDGMQIPFMAWSAGQKEFIPLLLAFYCLAGSPSQVLKKNNYEYVVIEEPEMGLHPQAIISVLLQILELVGLGYKVIVSTHSPVFLEFAWAFNLLKDKEQGRGVYELFGMDAGSSAAHVVESMLSKTIRTYYFSRDTTTQKVVTKDISSLDAGDENPYIAEWGGLASFAGRTSEVVAKYMSRL